MYISGECNVRLAPHVPSHPSVHQSLAVPSVLIGVPSAIGGTCVPPELSPSTNVNEPRVWSVTSSEGRAGWQAGSSWVELGSTRTLPIHFAHGWAALIGPR